MPKIVLSAPFVANAACPEGRKRLDYFDTHTRGLVLEVRGTGGKTYYLRYQDPRGRTRQLKLADAKDVALGQARSLADKARLRIAMGEDPIEDKAQLRQVPTFARFVDEQYLPFVKSYKRSWALDVSLLNNHLLPRFGKRYLDEIERQDVMKMHHDRKAEGAAPETANRVLVLMRYIYNLALKWEVPGVKANPTESVPLFEVNNLRERYLSVDEARRLYEAVAGSPNGMLRYIVSMLILTGARKREVLDSKWEDFDQARRNWRIPMSKSGRARHVPLSDGALNVLASIPRREGCDFAFPNPATGQPFVSIFYAWDTARKKAGLADVRVHDLRHSFASLLINQGRTLYEVQHILGHSNARTTQRYAHLRQDTLLAAANTATHAVGSVLLPMPQPTLPKRKPRALPS